MWTLEEKQKYLREHLDKDQFEEFFQFLQEDVGDFNIEAWANDFIIKLVDKFKRKKQEDNVGLQTSFYQYQANPTIPAVASMILGDIQKQKIEDTAEKEVKPSFAKPVAQKQPEKVEVVNKVPQQKHETKPQPPKRQSAFDLLDQIVKHPPTKPAAKLSNSGNLQHFKTHSPVVQKTQTPNASQFASNQFWNIGASNKNMKNNKSTQDFSSFQFWSQPSSSPEHTKAANFDNFTNAEFVKKEENKKNMVSFDEIVLKCDKQKGPSPYQKKAQHAEVAVEKEVKRAKSVTAEKAQFQGENEVSVKRKKKTAKVLYDGQVILRKQFNSTVKCFPSAERMKLKDPSLKASIKGHEIVKRNFLMPDYTMYIINISPLGLSLHRNYEDFQRLRQTLSRLFPATKLPYLQSNSWFSATSQDFIHQQKVMLQFFLNDLIRNPEMRNSKILEDFLTLTDHKKIKRKFEEWDKLEAPKSIEELCLLGGQVKVNLTEQQRLYQQNFKKYHERMVDFIERHQKLTHTLSEQLKEVEATQLKLTDLTKEMMGHTNYFNERVYDLQVDRISEALKLIHSVYTEQTKSTRFRQQKLESMIEPFLTYERENIKQMQGLIEVQQDFFKSYLKRSNNQQIDAKMPYTSEKVKYSKAGILTESKNMLVFKYQAGFLSNQVCCEAYRVIESLGDKYTALFKEYTKMCKHHEQKVLQFWSQRIYKQNGLIN